MVRHGDRYVINNDRGELIFAQLTPEGYREIAIELASRLAIRHRAVLDDRKVLIKGDDVVTVDDEIDPRLDAVLA